MRNGYPRHRSRSAFFALLIAIALLPDKSAAQEPVNWAATTESPRGLDSPPQAAEKALYRLCGQPDRGLARTARMILTRQRASKPPLTKDQLSNLVRAHGVPQPWPRAWRLAGISDPTQIEQRMGRWLAKYPPLGQRRCGIAYQRDHHGHAIVAAVTTDALADLAPLTTQTEPMRWLSLDAFMRVSAHKAQVVLLGPQGRPRRVLTSLTQGRIRSRFTLDQPGRWLVQVVAQMNHGPLPVIETTIFAGTKRPARLPTPLATPPTARHNPEAQLLTQLNHARGNHGLPALQRHPTLDRLARNHAASMMRAGKVAHNLGSGTPAERVHAAGLPFQHVGENVASAASADRAHRALWLSPSHRDNMLEKKFTKVGLGTMTDQQGRLWVTQLFAH